MKLSKLKRRLHKDRPMVSITLRMPEDVVEDLKRVAPELGFSGYQPLMRAYVGQGLRKDLERLEGQQHSTRLVKALMQLGVDKGLLAEAVRKAEESSESVTAEARV